jgi:hypothetical protein
VREPIHKTLLTVFLEIQDLTITTTEYKERHGHAEDKNSALVKQLEASEKKVAFLLQTTSPKVSSLLEAAYVLFIKF